MVVYIIPCSTRCARGKALFAGILAVFQEKMVRHRGKDPLSGRAKAKGIEEVVFDRGGCVYHGRVAALAEGAREGGLKF